MLSNEFKTAVLNGDVLAVRIMIKDSILLDTSGKMTDEMLKYVEEKHLKILEGYDGGALVLEPEKWNPDLLNLGLVELMGNFSNLRIDHLKRMAQKLYPQKTRERSMKVGKVETTRSDFKTPQEKRIAALQDIEKRANEIARLAEEAIKKEKNGFIGEAAKLIGPEINSKDKKSMEADTIRANAYMIQYRSIGSWERNRNKR